MYQYLMDYLYVYADIIRRLEIIISWLHMCGSEYDLSLSIESLTRLHVAFGLVPPLVDLTMV
jgi:hypothetical protein